MGFQIILLVLRCAPLHRTTRRGGRKGKTRGKEEEPEDLCVAPNYKNDGGTCTTGSFACHYMRPKDMQRVHEEFNELAAVKYRGVVDCLIGSNNCTNYANKENSLNALRLARTICWD